MKFDDAFFEDEVRSGFYVPSIMKRCWAAQMEVLEDVSAVCDKYGIRWFLDYGTLLGAVRHSGYIPWDDDLDICMLREDYEKFRQVASKELASQYAVKDYNSPNYDELWLNIATRNAFDFSEEYLDKYHGFPYVVSIDVFPLDYIAANIEDEQFRKEVASVVLQVYALLRFAQKNVSELEKEICIIEELCAIKLNRNELLVKQLAALVENLFMLYQADEADEVACMPFWIQQGKRHYSKEAYKTFVLKEFENDKYSIPRGYDEVLACIYGEYLKIVRGTSAHEYPNYEKMEFAYESLGGRIPYLYHLNTIQHRREIDLPIQLAVFVLMKASTWNVFQPMWEYLIQQNIDVKVIVVPYQRINMLGQVEAEYYKPEGFPQDVLVEDYTKIDLKTLHPDLILINQPYDQYQSCEVISENYYSSKIRAYTNQLIYIPWFETEEFDEADSVSFKNMRHYVSMPGVEYADLVIVQSENMRNNYVKYLSALLSGENVALLEKKIIAKDSEDLCKLF